MLGRGKVGRGHRGAGKLQVFLGNSNFKRELSVSTSNPERVKG